MFDAFVARLLGMDALDERFIAHRHRSSRLAMGVGVALMAAWFNYELFVHDRIELDLLVTLLAMAVVKVLSMAWLAHTD